VRLTTLPPSSAVVMKCGNLNVLGRSRPVMGLLYLVVVVVVVVAVIMVVIFV
jgi:hypothetical protein